MIIKGRSIHRQTCLRGSDVGDDDVDYINDDNDYETKDILK